MKIRVGPIEIYDITIEEALKIINRYSDAEPPRRKPTEEQCDKLVELLRNEEAAAQRATAAALPPVRQEM